jgi:CAAX prenyl protease-like protein
MIQQAIPNQRAVSGYSPTIAHVAPFAVFVGIMAAEHALSVPPEIGYPIRVAVTLTVVLLFSRAYIPRRPSLPALSIGIGLAVFALWVAPDLLFGYRHSWLFENALTGKAASVLAPGLKNDRLFLALRIAGSTLVVPIIEELFWRSWMMRWLIDKDFLAVPASTYSAGAFWITAVLFASEHGAYWEVGLAAGIVYNWWFIRTRNLADCILAHCVTNGVLAIYVLAAGQWQYWL